MSNNLIRNGNWLANRHARTLWKKVLRAVGDKRVEMPDGRLLQVAALPWKVFDGELRILLVTSRTTRRWILPKGWPQRLRSPFASALVEAFEEAGVKGTIADTPCGEYHYVKQDHGKDRPFTVAVYPCHVSHLLQVYPEAAERQRAWFSPEEAVERVTEPGLKEIIGRFGRTMSAAA